MYNPRGYCTTGVKTIDIAWTDRKLAKLTKTDAGGRKRFGEPRWSVLKRRLITLARAETLADVRNVGGFHALTADRAGSFAMKLDGAYRIVFRPDHDPVPQADAGGVDQAAVTAILIEEIVNYHD